LTRSLSTRSPAVEIKSMADTHVAVVPAAGGETVQLTSGRGQRFVGGWSPTGDQIVFEHRVTTGDLWMMELQ
jgi:Tol biopolymer transport system component